MTYEKETFPALLDTLESLATKPLSPKQESNSSLILGTTNIPYWMVWVLNILGLGVGIKDLRSISGSLRIMAFAVVPIGITGFVGYAITSWGLFSSTMQEETVRSSFGLEESGWWNAAPWFTVSAILCFLICKRIIKTKSSAAFI